ncbi:MAG: glycosyltransferase family 4 protein [Gaiellaceae bacterium]
MRILILHSRYSSGSTSGENRVVEDERRLLAEAGHHVDTWTPLYRESSSIPGGLGAVWSRRACAEVRRRVSEQRIDVVHAHNLFPVLSPAVLRLPVPTVLTLHNFRLACLPATLLRDGAICEDCFRHSPWRGVVHACYRSSRPASLVLATSLTVHRAIRIFDRVDRLIALSEFQRAKLAAAGIDTQRAVVRQNFAWASERRTGPGSYFLTLGRLSDEKGLDTVVSSWRSRLPLVVVGDGPERARLEAIARPGVEFRGAVEADEVPRLLRDARALLYPSRWYEGSPRAIVEALAAGVAVIASDMGGLPEHVEDDVSGLLVPADRPDAWAAAIERLENGGESERLGQGAHEAWGARFSPEFALSSLEEIYREAIERN